MEMETPADRAQRLWKDFFRQPCNQHHKLMLELLSESEARCSKAVELHDCMIDADPEETKVIQGGVVLILADCAGVYLARMHDAGPRITPLADLIKGFRAPFLVGRDERMVAYASLSSEKKKNRILVDVVVRNEKGDFRGQGRLEYAHRSFKK